MKTCPNCGTNCEDTASFCSNCSAVLGNAENTTLNLQKPVAQYSQPKNNGMALASMICGIASIACCGIAGIVGIILGFIAKKKILESNGAETGEGMAKAGIICGFIGCALWLIGIVIYILFVVLAVSTSHNNFYY